MSKVFTANRLAALASWSTGTAALILAFLGVFPHGWQNTALAIAGMLKSGATVLMFLRGSQQFDRLTAHMPPHPRPPPASNDVAKPERAEGPSSQEPDPSSQEAEIKPDSELARSWLQGSHVQDLEHAGFPDSLEQPAEPVAHPSELVAGKAVEQL